MLFNFYCDESYDGCPPGKARRKSGAKPHEPRTYVVAGFFSDQDTWETVESGWDAINQEFHVSRFHAAHLNGKTYEYEGWDDDKKITYSKALLKIITDQGRKMHAFTCGMLADKYREIISEGGREKLGDPYLVCFNTCLAWVSEEMNKGRFPAEDQIAVIFDRNKLETEAVGMFYRQKDHDAYPYRTRLATCTPASSEEVIPLQCADLLAYEVFKLLHVRRDNIAAEMRKVFSVLTEHIGYDGGRYFSERVLEGLKDGIEATVCAPNGLVILPPQE